MKWETAFFCFLSFSILLFQSSPFFDKYLLLFNLKINLIFLMVVFAYTRYNEKFAFIFTLIMGLASDFISNGTMGTYAMAFSFSCAPLIFLTKIFNAAETSVFIMLVLLASLVKALVLFFILLFLMNFIYAYDYLRNIGLLEILFNTLAAFPLHFAYRSIARMIKILSHYKGKSYKPVGKEAKS